MTTRTIDIITRDGKFSKRNATVRPGLVGEELVMVGRARYMVIGYRDGVAIYATHALNIKERDLQLSLIGS